MVGTVQRRRVGNGLVGGELMVVCKECGLWYWLREYVYWGNGRRTGVGLRERL